MARSASSDVRIRPWGSRGVGPDPYGGLRAGFSASTVINRNDFGVDIKMPMDGGGVVVGDTITVHLEIEAVLGQS